MSSAPEVIRKIKEQISEVDPREVHDLLQNGSNGTVIVDVREQNEWDESHIPGAVHVPRSYLESRIEARRRRQVLRRSLCASGQVRLGRRRARVLGYEHVDR